MDYLSFRAFIVKTVFVHDPISFFSMRSSTNVENKGFPHADPLRVANVDCFVSSSRFPKASCCRTVCSCTGWVFLVLVAKEIPLILWP